jgi:Aspartyl/Asparaginyl beta-hydroxylase
METIRGYADTCKPGDTCSVSGKSCSSRETGCAVYKEIVSLVLRFEYKYSMFFNEYPVKEILDIDASIIDNVVQSIEREFFDKWKSRSRLDHGTRVLKIIAPPPALDTLSEEDTIRINEIVNPIINALNLKDSEVINYAAVNLLPAGAPIYLHIDNIMIHILSRRIHVPLKTNPMARIGFLTSPDALVTVHMKKGTVYEFNNEVPHAGVNNGTEDRWHLMMDVIDKDIYQSIQKIKYSFGLGPLMNHIWSDEIYDKFSNALGFDFRASKK